MHVLTHALSLGPIGGIELSTVQDTVALTARGHQVDVLYHDEGELRGAYERGAVTLRGPVDFGFAPSSALRDLRGFLPSARWARHRRPDVLWLNRFEHIFWAQTVAAAAHCPIVAQLHHMPNYRRIHLLSHGVRSFVAVSEFVRQRWIASGLKPDRISVVHNAVAAEDYPAGGRPERSHARQVLALPAETPIVLYYGRMVADKGVPTLLEAWRRLGWGPDRALLVLVGSTAPDDDDAVRRGLAALSTDAYRWLPDQREMTSFLHAADLVVFPSELPEAFGRVIIESMTTGRPVVASRVGAVPEILRPPFDELMFAPGSASELADRLRGLLGWRDERPDLGRDCAEMVGRRFVYSAHVDALEDVLGAARR